MMYFAIALVTAAFQVTLVALLAIVVIAWVGRRSPRAGANLATAALAACALLSVVAVVPMSHWWAWNAPAIQEPAPFTAGSDGDISPSNPGSEPSRFPLRRLIALLSAPTASPAEPEQRWNRWTIIGGIFLIGLGVEVTRLLCGLWGVAGIRRRSLVVNDADLIAQTNKMREDFGLTRPVAVRQSAAVGTAATFGWRRPVILLANDWPTWEPSERQAVLAHELAHVRRRDYLTSLFATLCRAAHFYHPLVRWLASRLRLHQELAADAMAATISGGRAGYLQILARMALRQDAAVIASVARPFLSDRRSLLRRVAMLRVMEDIRPLSRAARWSTAVLLIAAVLGASAVRGPAQAPAVVPADDVPAFDVSHVPASANVLVAFRPAAILAKPGMKPLADRFNQLLAAELQQGALAPLLAVTVQEIEQMVVTAEGRSEPLPLGRGSKPGEARPGIHTGAILIRMTHDFDWPAVVRNGAAAFKAEVKELKPGLFRVVGTEFYFHVLDRRTLLFNPEGDTESLVAGHKPAADPAAARGPAWAKAQRSAAVIAFDNRKGFWTDFHGPAQPGPNLLTVLGRPSHIIACLELADEAMAHVYITADEKVQGQKRCDLNALVEMLLTGVRPNPEPWAEITRRFLDNRSIMRDGTSDIAELRMKEEGKPVPLANLLQMIDLPRSVKENSP